MDQPIVRTYCGASRAAAEGAYRTDAGQAEAAGYTAVSHRWTRDWDGHTLSVVYERREGAEGAGATSVQPTTATGDDLAAGDEPAAAATGDEPAAAATGGDPAAATDGDTAAGMADRPVSPAPDEPARHAPPSPHAAAPDSPARPALGGRRSTLTLQVVDMHCAGEPLRIIRSGFPDVPHLPVLERRRWVEQNADHVRRAIIHEPRGHRDMYGAILLPAHDPAAEVCLLFMHNEGYSTMCGHGVIAVTTALIEEGLMPATEPVTTIGFEVPAGLVAASANVERQPDGMHLVRGVRFTNVPSYLAAESLAVVPDGVALHGAAAESGSISVDLAFGGAYYGIVDAADLGLRVVPEQAEALRRAGAAITDVLRREHTPSHPTDADLGFVYGTIIVDREPQTSPDGRGSAADMRNVTIFADAELDRSPCGSGTSAILAQLWGRGRLQIGDEIVNAGITGESFVGRVEAPTQLGAQPAVRTSVAGSAYVTGYATLVVDERDPLAEGFLLG